MILIQLLRASISSALPIAIAAVGALYTQLAGKLNIAIEGLMLLSCFVAVYVADRIGLLIAVLSAMLVSCLISVVVWLLHRYLMANIFVVGVGINILTSGFVVLLSSTVLGSKGTVFFENIQKIPIIRAKFFEKNSLLQAVFSGYNVLELFALSLIVVSWLVVRKTPFGLRLRVLGKSETVASHLGLNVNVIRLASFVLCGLFCGLAGAMLSLPLGLFVTGMTNNRGWLALVATVLGGENPSTVFIVSLVLGLTMSLSNRLQIFLRLPAEIVLSLPLILTLCVVLLHNILKTVRRS
ncbi:ABC transporter permease [Pseudothermotoga sp.]|nr:ABC transporter permease [Pseudothermotoga sp.]MCX7812785.1 ABC transporter permease [Pseudothermotoga sp.]MDW8139065.1 ABC transporter permease [Pseudothermotoga sp.]